MPELSFPHRGAAYQWLDQQMEKMEEFCVDNYRFAYLDDQAMMAVFEKQREQGCCGTFEQNITVGGRPAIIGCNYGH